jgi:glutathione peroxidase
MISVLITICFIVYASAKIRAKEDANENCNYWASIGECSKNPGYMLKNCALSCDTFTSKTPDKSSFGWFYDIIETDITGKELNFENFRNKVVYIVNVASHCGYTAENYETFRRLKPFRERGLEIVIAPCNQFGYQEPGDGVAISKFATRNEFEGIILSKADVNGDLTRPAFKFLKQVTNRQIIGW